MSTDSDDEFVRLVPMNGPAYVEIRRRETRVMFPDTHAVQVKHRAELRLVDFHDRDCPACRCIEPSAVPEIISLLMGYSANVSQLVVIRLTVLVVVNQRRQKLLGLVFVHVGEGRSRGMCQAGNRHRVVERMRHLLGRHTVIDIPYPVERHRSARQGDGFSSHGRRNRPDEAKRRAGERSQAATHLRTSYARSLHTSLAYRRSGNWCR